MIPVPHLHTGAAGKALEKAFSKKTSCFAVMLQLFMFQVSNAMTN